ncbi:MAG: type II secretion system protein GspJ [Planctomycetota bacterium]|jgi:general secretion pathway protein J
MIAARPRRRTAGGFTLVELLVALTLTGLIFVALFGGLRFGARTWETGIARSEVAAQVEIAQSLLRRLLTQAILIEGDRSGESTFDGETDQLRFTAPAPSQVGLGGVYLFELFTEASEASEENRHLVLRWRVYRKELDPESPPDDEPRKRRVLLDGIETLRFEYFGDPETKENPQWLEGWSGHDALPKLVSVKLELPADDRRRWPELIIAPSAAMSAGLP